MATYKHNQTLPPTANGGGGMARQGCAVAVVVLAIGVVPFTVGSNSPIRNSVRQAADAVRRDDDRNNDDEDFLERRHDRSAHALRLWRH